MIKQIVATTVALGFSVSAMAGGADDPLLYKVMIDKLETRNADGDDPVILEADAWIGYDLDKLWIKTDVERVNGNTEEAEVQLLYSHAIAPFWDIQVGWRHNTKPEPDRNYLAIGLQGLAPYQFDINSALYVGKSGQVGMSGSAEYEYMLTQQWVLSPEAGINLYSKDDEAAGIGSGISDLELGLRLGYEMKREFAPYIGVNWNKKVGQTADYASAEGETVEDTQFVAGVRIWF